MTYKQKYNQNAKLIVNYDNYLMSDAVLSFEQRIKLINEIARLSNQNEIIDTMPVKDFDKDCYDYTILQTSIL